MLLIASLPANDTGLARAAARAGADLVKVHLNVVHRTSGTHFGVWADEKERILEILDAVDIPVGVMPGAGEVASEKDWAEMAAAGISFFDIYAEHCPEWMWRLPVKKMPAISKVPTENELKDIVRGGGVDWLEASVVNPDDYGKPLSAGDLENYKWIAGCVNVPVVVPTQKAITPEDVPRLADAGVGGLMVGKIVTGGSEETLFESVSAFRLAIDRLK